MDCQDCLRFLPDYLQKSLPGGLSKEIEEHIGSCGRCRSELLLMEKIDHSLRAQGLLTPPAGFTERLMHRLSAVERPAMGPVFWKTPRAAAWAAATIGFVVFLSLLRGRIGTAALELSSNLIGKLQNATTAVFDRLPAFSLPPFPSISPQASMIVSIAISMVFLAWSFWLVGRTVRVLRE